MGVVYRAVDPMLGRTVALKTIRIASCIAEKDRAAFEERFLAEARAAAAVAHPAVVVVHDVGRDPETGDLFIAFEHLVGRTLAELMAAGTAFDHREALRLTAQIAEALHHAHSCGVVHRDLKPANVMILPSGQPKVLDFGVAKQTVSALTLTGEVLGTPLYMSPEQALGEDLDGRSDLFSLGSVLYMLLTGRHAFDAGSVLAIVERVLRASPVPPSQIAPALPEEVDLLVARALAKAPTDRYPDGNAFAQDIERYLGRRERPSAAARGVIRQAPPDADSPLAFLVSDSPGAEDHAAGSEGMTDQVQNRPPTPTPGHPDSRTKRLPRRIALLAAGAMSLVTCVSLGIRALAHRSTPPSARAAGSSATVPSILGLPPKAAGSTEATDPAAREGQLVVSLDHPFDRCALRVSVAGATVVQEVVTTPGKDFWTPVRVGEHEVKVEVGWADGEKSEEISGSFPTGSPLHLLVHVEPSDHSLSLQWR